MIGKVIYICEDSVEGIFTAIYEAWESKRGHQNNQIVLGPLSQYEMFCTYIEVAPKVELAGKVSQSIKRKLGAEIYQSIYNVICSSENQKAEYIYRFLILAFANGKNCIHYISNEWIGKVMSISQRVYREAQHFSGFVRFVELENSVLCAKIRPENNILPLISPHFAERLSIENWMIIDERRNYAVIHPRNGDWYLVDASLIAREQIEYLSEGEKTMKKTWDVFVKSIAIKERSNDKLQKTMCPLRYREFMPEFQK